MNAQQLAKRVALSQLVEFDMESAQPEQLPPPPDVIWLSLDDDLDLRAGDTDLDVMQSEEEQIFFSQMNHMRGNREVRRHLRDW